MKFMHQGVEKRAFFQRLKGQGISCRVGRFGVYTYRRMRAARFSWEYHNHPGVSARYISVGIASPTKHRWWATQVNFYWRH